MLDDHQSKSNENNRIVCFIDLLGFRNCIHVDQMSALGLLAQPRIIMIQKITDGESHPVESYDLECLKKIAGDHLTTSFEYYLPFSDSILITSKNPDVFIKQISCFLLECFKLTSKAYNNPENPSDPTEVTIKYHTIDNKGAIILLDQKEHWFPTAFRGGVCFGPAIPFKNKSIENYSPSEIQNISGTAIVEAVGLENSGKGPRLFCSKKFIDFLDPSVKYLIAPLKDNKNYEILWPSAIYLDGGDPNIELKSFDELFGPTVKLWQAFNHLEISLHYYNFIKLVVLSTIKYFKDKGMIKETKAYIEKAIDNSDIAYKKNELLSLFDEGSIS
jgi:hypothetical protein